MYRNWPRICLYVGLASGLASARSAAASTVSGRVEDSTGQSVAGARITLFDDGLVTFLETRTDDDGEYRLDEAPQGDLRLGVAAPGFEYVEETLTLSTTAMERDFSLEREAHPGRWTIVGNTLPEFLDATDIGILSPEGKVFYCHDTEDPILFDPVTGEKSFPRSSGAAQGCMNGTLLDNGDVIMFGGQNPGDPGSFRNAVRWVKTYSFAGDEWIRLADMQLPAGRWYPGLARLADGSFLIMGGGTRPNAQRTATCEIFDPIAKTTRFTGDMLNPAEFPPSALLFTGEVLATWSPPQLYNPATGRWRTTGNFQQPERGWPGHSDHSLVVLADGRAVAIGVRGEGNTFMGEIFDPATEEWSVTSNPGLVRFQCEVVQLPDGRILVAGGETEDPSTPVSSVLGLVKWCDLYEPQSDSWRRVADMRQSREYHAVTLLVPDGRVLMTGGTRIKFRVGPSSADIEAFEPPYLFRGVRPRITSLSSGSRYRRGAGLSLEIAPETRLTSVVLMGTDSVTHWVSAGTPRRLVLQVEQDGPRVSTVLPSDPDVLTVGYYMLFAMVDDIPSVARIIKVDDSSPEFLRGDANSDGKVEVADAVFSLTYLFLRGPPPECFDAADANDDAFIDVADPVRTLLSLFMGLEPPDPFPACGSDPTPEDLDCESYPQCP